MVTQENNEFYEIYIFIVIETLLIININKH